MTGTVLLFYISTAIILQVLLFGGASLRRYRPTARVVSIGYPDAASPESDASWNGWREFRVTRRTYEDLGHSQCSFYLEPTDGLRLPAFKPGQFLTFQVDTPSQTVIRCYSLSDKPSAEHYRVTIKRHTASASAPGLLSGLASNHFHSTVQPGDILRVRSPAGAFFVDPDPNHDIVLIAGGIGITPLLSMLLWCTEEQPIRQVHLYYGVRQGEDQVFKQQLALLADTHPQFHLIVAYSQPTTADTLGRDYQHQGHVDLDLMKRTLPPGHYQFYICGPAPMMQTLVPALLDWGVASADIHFEAFGPASVRSSTPTADAALPSAIGDDAASFEVHFLESERTLVWTAASGTLLNFAELHGIRVEAGCRAGSCGTCETRLISGTVRYADKPDHHIATGQCLLCVGMPSSNLVIAA